MNLFHLALLIIFAIHLLVFARLGLKRREWYYLALVVTFSLLCTSVSLRLLAPELRWGGVLIADVLRYAAWAAALVSISWTVRRALQRRRGQRALR